MKTTFPVLFLLVAHAAFGQLANYTRSQPQPYHSPENPAHASTHALAQEQYVVGGTTYTSAHGEKPTWELPQGASVPLGDIARTLRKELAKLKKARCVHEN